MTNPSDDDLDLDLDACLAAGFETAAARPPSEDEPWGRYDVGERLGAGGLGVVRRGVDRRLGRVVALKRLRDEIGEDVAAQQRFVEEAQIGGQLQHPGIVPVYELGEAGERPFFAMKLIEGETLAERLERRAPTDLAELLDAFERVCQAVAFAHDRGVIHRDLKPANVMLGRFGEVLVVDWGMAKVLGSAEANVATVRSDVNAAKSVSGSVMGTYAYMAPEQARGDVDAVRTQADVFALGSVLCELLTGAPAYRQPAEQLRAAAEHADLSEAHQRLASVDATLGNLARRCLSVAIHDRPTDAGAIATAIAAWRGTTQERAEAARIALAEARVRNRAILVVALVLVAGLAAALWYWREAHTARQRAETLLERFELLADIVRLREAKATINNQWPPWPENADRLAAWLRQHGRPLVAVIDRHRDWLTTIRSEALPWTPRERDAWAAKLSDKLREARTDLAYLEPDHELYRAQRSQYTETGFAKLRDDLRRNLDDLERRARTREEHTFELGELRFLHDALAQFVRDLEEFTKSVDRMEAMHRWSRTVAERSIETPAKAWREAIAAIAAAPQYGGLQLKPQTGLIPLRVHPKSGLWEFLHLASGTPGKERPDLDAASGQWKVTEDSGILFVLVPAARAITGAQIRDPDAPRYDARALAPETPTVTSQLDAYFLAAHELTQGQWLRLSHEKNPSTWHAEKVASNRGVTQPAITLAHPVESVGYNQVRNLLLDWGLELPSEAQWEHACRAGTDTRYHTGNSGRSLRGFANLNGANVGDLGAEDPYIVHAPAGTFPPNPWGFYNMHGNVAEWCLDWMTMHTTPTQPGNGVFTAGSPDFRMVRGGHYLSHLTGSRCSSRNRLAPKSVETYIGVRPYRRIR